MPIPEFFKYDVRVRERMLRKGTLTDGELTKHVDALGDVADQVVEVELKQPALQKESERIEMRVSRPAPRPVVARVPSLDDDLDDLDDEDDDLDDEDDEDEDDDAEEGEAKAAPKPAVEAVVEEKKPAADEEGTESAT